MHFKVESASCEVKRLLVIGRNGQLGRSVAKMAAGFPQLQIDCAGRDKLDMVNPGSIESFFAQHHYDLILNSAAYTAVDQAESEPEQAEQLNHYAVAELARVAKQQQSFLIHVSTDYVFDGESNTPYLESDATNPVGVYGSSKLRGEQALQEITPKGCIVRTSWLYSEFGNNFVKTMLRLGKEREQLNVVSDQIGSPTYASDLAQVLLTIATREAVSQSSSEVPLFHYANQGIGSWYDFATAIFELAGLDCMTQPITTAEYPTAAKRPHFSVLNTVNIRKQFQISIPYWRDSLKRCLAELT